uniref:Myelin protein zero-like protein 1 n=1 Tax=Oncorhynchus tshawytscha TaxID=74940 RepID=A0AAZ3NYF0_ONCTS
MELRRRNLACNCVLLYGITLCLFSGTNLTAAIELYAPAEVLVENGTTGILKCSFKSREVISSAATVTWSFRPTGSDPGSAVSGPVIYAQLDHSGTKNPNSFHKMEPVVYADIRKN